MGKFELSDNPRATITVSYWQAGADFARKEKPFDKLIDPPTMLYLLNTNKIVRTQYESYFNGYRFVAAAMEKEFKNGK